MYGKPTKRTGTGTDTEGSKMKAAKRPMVYAMAAVVVR